MIPSSSQEGADKFGSKLQEMEKNQHKDAWARFRGEFLGLTQAEKLLFGEPADTPENQFARNAWERLNAMPKYLQEREKIMLLMRRTAQNVFKAMELRAGKEVEIHQDTRDQLEDLADGFYRHMLAIGQANKTINPPHMYSPERDDEDTVESSSEVIELNEIILMRTAMEGYAKLDSEELIAMTTEDHGFVTMLIQERNLNEFGWDPNAEPDKLDLRDKRFSGHNLEDLRKFILGPIAKGGEEKSKMKEMRRGVEVVLWLEIVRGLTTEQKGKLVGTFLKNGAPSKALAEAQDFISACVIANVMTIEEAEHITRDYPRLNENDFKKKLEVAMSERDKAAKEMADVADRMEHMRGQNFMNQYATFNNIILGRIVDLGMMTVAVNCFLTIGARIDRRTDPDRNESFAKALAFGVGDVVKNKCVWLGAGVAATTLGSFIPGGLSSLALAPNAEEKQNSKKYMAFKYVRERVGDNHERGDYLVEHYNDWMKIAERRRGEGEGLVVHPKDIKITPQKAGELGYASDTEAQKEMAKLFTVCAVPLGKKNENELKKYFQDRVYATIRDEHAEKPNVT